MPTKVQVIDDIGITVLGGTEEEARAASLKKAAEIGRIVSPVVSSARREAASGLTRRLFVFTEEELVAHGLPVDEETTCDVWCKICKKTCKKPLLNHGDVHECGHTKDEAGG